MTEPLPCPFCGEDVAPNIIQVIGCSDRYYIQCYSSECEVNPSISRSSQNEEQVIKKWNKRKD